MWRFAIPADVHTRQRIRDTPGLSRRRRTLEISAADFRLCEFRQPSGKVADEMDRSSRLGDNSDPYMVDSGTVTASDR